MKQVIILNQAITIPHCYSSRDFKLMKGGLTFSIRCVECRWNLPDMTNKFVTEDKSPWTPLPLLVHCQRNKTYLSWLKLCWGPLRVAAMWSMNTRVAKPSFPKYYLSVKEDLEVYEQKNIAILKYNYLLKMNSTGRLFCPLLEDDWITYQGCCSFF